MENPKKKHSALSNSEILANKPEALQQVKKPKPFPIKRVVMLTGAFLLALMIGLIILAVYIGNKVDEKKRADYVDYLKCDTPSSQPASKKFNSTLISSTAKVTIHDVIYNVPPDYNYVSGSKSDPNFGCKKGLFIKITIEAKERYVYISKLGSSVTGNGATSELIDYEFDKYSTKHSLRIIGNNVLTSGEKTTGWLVFGVDLESNNDNVLFKLPGSTQTNQQNTLDISQI